MGKIGIISAREFNERVRKKSFVITTILMPLLLILLMVAAVLMVSFRSEKRKDISVIDRSGIVAASLEDRGGLHFTVTDMTVEQIMKDAGDIYGILEIGEDIVENPRNVRLLTYGPSTIDTETAISSMMEDIIENERLRAYDIENLRKIMDDVSADVTLQVSQISSNGETKAVSNALNIAIAYLFGLLIYLVVFLYGSMVMQGVIEEKSNKVLEVMVSSVRPFDMMMGKILGIASVALVQFAIWVVFLVGVGGLVMHLFASDILEAAQAMQSGMPMDMSSLSMSIDAETAAIISTVTSPAYLIKIFGGFLVFFIGGYFLYAAMFAAVGSAVDNEKDSQNLQMPITIPLVLALLVMFNAMQDPDGGLAFWFSIIPFTSPIVMMARIPYGVPAWQMCLSVGLLAATFVLTVWVAGKIYRVGIFMYGKKPTLRELGRWIRYRD